MASERRGAREVCKARGPLPSAGRIPVSTSAMEAGLFDQMIHYAIGCRKGGAGSFDYRRLA